MLFWLYLPVAVLGQLLAYPLVPIAVAFADEDGRLPWSFRWLETHDNLGWAGPMSEPEVLQTMVEKGQKAALRRWLWRNKAYTLRHWMRARITEDMARVERGVSVPKRWGYSAWYARIGRYWEWQPRIGLGSFHLYFRIGWKLKPYFDSPGPYAVSAGIFQGLSLRSDDWDDYGEAEGK